MYQIPHEHFYKLYDVTSDEFIDYFYSDDELIKFIARWFKDEVWIETFFNHRQKKKHNSFIEKCTCDVNDLVEIGEGLYYKTYILFDNFGRIINIHDFKSDALKLYEKWKADGTIEKYIWANIKWRSKYRYKIHNLKKYTFLNKMASNFEYRKDPVPHTRKSRGGSWWRSPHTIQIKRMYANPEYKDFNRGSCRKIPSWWDEKDRCVQKSWKTQSKARHQWEKRK